MTARDEPLDDRAALATSVGAHAALADTAVNAEGAHKHPTTDALDDTVASSPGDARRHQASASAYSDSVVSSPRRAVFSDRRESKSNAGSAARARADTGRENTIAATTTGPVNSAAEPGFPSVGRLKLLRRLGAGGMGVVYAAYDPELDREVAVKLIRGDSELASARLLREAQALAKLTHPNVVAVHDVGTHAGQVWVSMEFVVGRTLGAWIEGALPTWRQVLSVILQAARGIAAAHAEGVLHRDIKPDNIMVGDDDRVRVMDFGLARAGASPQRGRAGERDASAFSVELTAAGAIMGTPAYMAPEQFLGLVADERTDVFALAVTLWEALYGSRPFIGETFAALNVAVTSGAREPAPAGSNVPVWLRRVLERALEVDRKRRFESARVMIEAIEIQLQRARTRSLVAGLSLGLLVVAALGVLATFQWRRAVASETTLMAREVELESTVAELEKERVENQRSLSVQRGLRAKMLIPENREGEALKLGVMAVGSYGPGWDPAPPREAIDALEHVLADDAEIIRPALTINYSTPVYRIAYSPDGLHIASSSADHKTRVWSAQSGALVATLEGHENVPGRPIYSPDGTRIVTASADKTARVWNAMSGELLATLRHGHVVTGTSYSPDGARIVTGCYDQSARIWNADSGELLAAFQDHEGPVFDATFSPDGARVATACYERTVRIWDAKSGAIINELQGHEGILALLAYSPDGTHIAAHGRAKTARVWDAESGTPIATLQGHENEISALVYSPTGARIATASQDKTARIWDASSGELIATLQGHEGAVQGVVYSRDGDRVATISTDYTARVWDADSGKHIATLQGHTNEHLNDVVYSPDDAHIATSGQDNTVRIWDAPSRDDVATLPGHGNDISALAYSPDGAFITTASFDHTARIWDARSGELVATLLGHEDKILALAYSPDGTRVATASVDKTVKIWAAASGALETTLRGHMFDVVALSYSPDGARLATASIDRTARIWDARSGDLLDTLVHEDSIADVAFSPDGTRVATASRDKEKTARIWDATSGELIATLRGHRYALEKVVYSPDGTRIATAGHDRTARIWDAATGEPLVTLEGHRGSVLDLAFSPDGTRVATASFDRTTRTWDAVSGEALATLEGHQDEINAVAYSRDGALIATASNDQTARIWNATTYVLVATLDDHERAINDISFSPNGRTIATASSDFTAKLWDPETGELLTDLTDRISLRLPNGSFTWPIPPRELTRIGCLRLKPLEKEYLEAAEICDPLLAVSPRESPGSTP